jgi:hypothetical protein
MQSQTCLLPVTCQLLNLGTHTTLPPATGAVLNVKDPLIVQVTVQFGGDGAIALMPLGLSIRVDFFARSMGIKQDLDLGTTVMPTEAGIFIYQPRLEVQGGTKAVNLLTDRVYEIRALLRVGAPGHPALITGTMTGFMLQTYTP